MKTVDISDETFDAVDECAKYLKTTSFNRTVEVLAVRFLKKEMEASS